MESSKERPMAGKSESTWPSEQYGRPQPRSGEVAEQASRVTELAAARGREFVSSAKEQAQHAADYVQGAIEPIREKVAQYTEGGFDKMKEDAIGYTRREPVNALLIAAGVGLIIGWLTAFGRR